jgi:hypothetical protein
MPPATERRALLMDAIALAQVLDGSRGSDGTISLRQLQVHLTGRGLEELACAVRSLAERLTPAVLSTDLDDPPVIVPWF